MFIRKVRNVLSQWRRYLLSPNRQIRDWRRLMFRREVRCTLKSNYNGEVKVVDLGRERLLLLDGRCHSFGMTRGSDSELYREYWGALHRTPFPVPAQPRVLMCGLGGGTGLKILARELRPASITVIELDPVIVEVARQYFGVDDIPGIEILTGDEREITAALAARAERFDLVVEDAICLPTCRDLDAALAQFQQLSALLAPGGSLVLNSPIVHKPADADRTTDFCNRARVLGMEVGTRDTGQRWWFNRMVYARPRPA